MSTVTHAGAPAAAEAVVSCEGVTFTYDREGLALDGVSLSVPRGSFTCVLGANGSGKSTLARHLNALLVPDSGRVLVDGIDTSERECVYDVRSRVGMVFQSPDDQIVATLVEDDVAFGPENLGVPAERLGERVTRALVDVGLAGFERHETNALSGGQKQRVAIAGALAMEPEVLVLDEASAMLDPRGRSGLMRVVRRLNARGMTVVMVTHYMAEAAEADHVVVLDAGRVRMEGTPQEVLTRADELAGLGLEVPPACRLALALGEAGVAGVRAQVREEELVGELAGMVAERATGTLRDASPAAEAVPATTDARAAATPAADSPDAPLIELEHVWFSYEPPREHRSLLRGRLSRRAAKAAWGNEPDAVWALRDVSLQVRRGEFVGVAGHTGSGKSTLVQLTNGLARPTRGTVRAFGEDLGRRGAPAGVVSRVGVVFQYPERQLFAETVFDDVAFGPRNLGCDEAEVARRVERSLAQVGLDAADLSRKGPFELSGGQRRRVAFAGVLAMEPEVLVLDEPAAGLDPVSRRSFLSLVSRLHGEGLTVVMVSHDMDDLASLCTRVVVMNEGAVALEGSPADVFLRGAELRSIGLGLPSAQRMAEGLRARGVPLPGGRLYSMRSLAAALAPMLGVRA